MDRVNELLQATIETKASLLDQEKALDALLKNQAAAKAVLIKLLEKKAAGTLSKEEGETKLPQARVAAQGFEPRLEAQRAVIAETKETLMSQEKSHAAEAQRLASEDAGAEPRARARGFSAIGLPYHEAYGRQTTIDDDAPATSALPPLPGRTRAAIARLFPGVGASSQEQRVEQWHGVLSAALGGMPLHPSVLAATSTEGVPGDGGFMVTPEVAAGIFMRGAEASVWLRIGVPLIPMTADERIANAIDDNDETSDAEGGLTASWKGETEDAGDPQVLRIRQVKLTARKLVLLAAVSNELAEDAPGYVLALEAALSRAIGKKVDRSVLSGSGAGQPLGILNSAATITVTKQGGQPASTFLWENATAMWARLAPGSHERAWWLIHPTVLPQALSMHMVIGTAGTQPAAVFQMGGPTGYMLLGRPVLVTSRVKALGTKGDVILVDPTQLAVGIRRQVTIERSEHAFFGTDRLAIRAKFRGDARPFWETPLTLVEGNTTVSPIVVLEAR